MFIASTLSNNKVSKTRSLNTVKLLIQWHVGDAMSLVAAVKLLDQTLQTYEHEAELVATANGWNTRNSIVM